MPPSGVNSGYELVELPQALPELPCDVTTAKLSNILLCINRNFYSLITVSTDSLKIDFIIFHKYQRILIFNLRYNIRTRVQKCF